jgi:Tfp pilus assembly protein FimT
MKFSGTLNVDSSSGENRSNPGERGASVVELLIVVSIITIMVAFTIFSAVGHKKAYKTDDQTLQIIDVLRAASLRAVTQRQTIRVEINLTSNKVRMIDENTPSTTSDDAEARTLLLDKVTDVKLSAQPLNAATLPPSPSNFPVAVFAPSVHPSSTGNNVCTIRFSRNGTVLNAGTNGLGASAAITSTTLYVWPPQSADPTRAVTPRAVRAITIFGPSGNIRLWKYNGTSFVLG